MRGFRRLVPLLTPAHASHRPAALRLRLFTVLVFIVSLLFFGFGIVAFVQAETLKQQITDNWTTIRRVLPPTFSGKYDQEQFTNFLEANLNAAGFISLCMGVLLMTQVWAG